VKYLDFIWFVKLSVLKAGELSQQASAGNVISVYAAKYEIFTASVSRTAPVDERGGRACSSGGTIFS